MDQQNFTDAIVLNPGERRTAELLWQQLPPGLATLRGTVGLVDTSQSSQEALVSIFSGSDSVWKEKVKRGAPQQINVQIEPDAPLHIKATANGDRYVCLGDMRLES